MIVLRRMTGPRVIAQVAFAGRGPTVVLINFRVASEKFVKKILPHPFDEKIEYAAVLRIDQLRGPQSANSVNKPWGFL